MNKELQVSPIKVIPFNCIAHPFCVSFFAWLVRARACARSELDRFSMEAELFREINGHFLLNELGEPTFLFHLFIIRKIRLYMIYSNLTNFSLFNFEIFRLIHYYSQILGVSLEPCRRSICLLFQISFIVTAILRHCTSIIRIMLIFHC